MGDAKCIISWPIAMQTDFGGHKQPLLWSRHSAEWFSSGGTQFGTRNVANRNAHGS